MTHYPFPTYQEETRYLWQYHCEGGDEGSRCDYKWVEQAVVKKSNYFLAGQAIATRITGDPVSGNNGLFYFLTDHLGSTTMLITAAGAAVAGTAAYYQPYGNYRTSPTTLTERGYTGHHENRDIGLTYMNARYYIPGLGRFLTADTLIPDPTNPQSHNRYTYVLGNSLRYTDPTGHDCYDPSSGDLFGTCTGGFSLPLPPPPPGFTSTPCLNCGWSSQFGDMGRAYQVFAELERLLGRPLTYEEILALVAHHEFGWILQYDQAQYDIALEAMARQFYHFCGADGICQGDELWKFLGAQQAWFDGNAAVFAHELTSGSLPPINFAGARRILEQPIYNPATATSEEKRANWRSGNGDGDVPFKYGNYSMFTPDIRAQLEIAPAGINGNARHTIFLNRPDLNNGNGYVVMTMGQFNYWWDR